MKNKLFRSFGIRKEDINTEARTVNLSFSSEQPVERWFGMEILDHNPDSVDLSRLQDSAPVLVDHSGDQVGVVMEAEVKNKKGFATLRFSQGKRGKEVFQDIEDGIRKNVSVGYVIRKFEETKEEGKEPVFRALDWMPLEISIVSVPADQTVGVGRSFEDLGIEVVRKEEEKEEEEEEKKEEKYSLKEKILTKHRLNYST